MILAIDSAQMTYSAALSNGWHTEWEDVQTSLYHILKSQDLNQVTGIIINIGPGRFSGIRSGLAFAKGLAHARNIPLFAVSHFQAIAFKYPKQEATIVLDARKHEVYVQHFSNNNAVTDIYLASVDSLSGQNICGNITGDIISIRAKDLLLMVDTLHPTPAKDVQAIYIRPATS